MMMGNWSLFPVRLPGFGTTREQWPVHFLLIGDAVLPDKNVFNGEFTS